MKIENVKSKNGDSFTKPLDKGLSHSESQISFQLINVMLESAVSRMIFNEAT
jgi:hypothetical protein